MITKVLNGLKTIRINIAAAKFTVVNFAASEYPDNQLLVIDSQRIIKKKPSKGV